MREPTRAKGIRLSVSLWEAVEAAAEAEGRSVNGWLAQAVRDAARASYAHLQDRDEKVAERERLKAALRGDYDYGKA